MEKFTKGEWEIDYTSTNMLCIDSDNGQVCEVNSNYRYVAIGGCSEIVITPTPEQKANANLIACAPEMYEMLKHLVDHDCISDCSLHKECTTLLGKARGDS